MKKAALWLGAAGVVAGMAMPRHASAAEMFADVPTDHWAYQAVNNLQERGIVIGYPDGTFGGKRAMTRYEFAVAVDRLVDWVNKSIAAIPPATVPPPPSTGGVTEDRVRELIDERVKDLPTKEDLETVRRLVDEFKDELTALGTNVEALRRDLDSLKARVGAIEERLNRWHFSGEGNMIERGSRSSKATLPGNPSARPAVIDLNSRTDNNGTNDILQNLQSLYSLDFGITGRVSSGVTANALLNFGNYLPWVNSNRQNPGVTAVGGNAVNGYASDRSTIPALPTGQGIAGPVIPTVAGPQQTITQGNFGTQATNTSLAEFTPVRLYLESPVRNLWFLKDIDATVGKFGVQFTPYTLKQVDPDSYTDVTLTDNGDIIGTGAMAKGSIGGIHLTGYAANHYNGRSFNTGYPVFISWGGPTVLSAQTYGALQWDQSMGVHGTYQLGRFALGGTYITAGLTDPPGTPGSPFSNNPYVNNANPNNDDRQMVPQRAEVAGGNLAFPIVGKLAFTGEYAESNTLAGANVGDREGVYPSRLDNAYDGKLTWGVGRLSVAGGYKQVDPFFGAPGAWGNIGRWQNPTNIKGWNASAGYNFGGFTLKGNWEDYKSVRIDAAQGTSAIPNLVSSVNGDRNKIQHYTAGLSYNLGTSNNIDLGYEDARIRPWNSFPSALGSGKTNEQYWTIGLGHKFNDNTGIKVLYQIVDYKDNGAGLYTVAGGAYKGGIGVTQLSVKF